MRIRLISLLLLASSSLALADTAEQTARAAISKLVPNAVIEAIAPAPIAGFQEVVMNGQVLYVSNDGKYLLQGNLFDINNKMDLTDKREGGLRKTALSGYGKDKRIVYPAKNPKHTVTVFTDIDCGYCRKMHNEMSAYNAAGITIEYMFFPRAGIGSDSYKKTVSVWCAADKVRALTAAKNGSDPAEKTCANPIADEYNLGLKVGVSGTPAIYSADGTQIGGYLPPDQMLQRLNAMNAAK